MKKKNLVFSNGEKLGDGIIKLPFLHEIKNRLPNHQLIWVTNKENTAFNNQLKKIAFKYIDKIIEKVDLSPFFWKKISHKYNFENEIYDFVFDTQKAIYRTIALKRLNYKSFISGAANGLFSTKKIKNKSKIGRKYYLDELIDLLDLISLKKKVLPFKISTPRALENKLIKFFEPTNKYFGIAPGAGEKNRIWPLENFIKIGKHFENKNYRIVLYLGPNEKKIRNKLITVFPNAIIPEEKISDYSNIETIITSTKFIEFALANDSGAGHILSLGFCRLYKLFGHHDARKFTPYKENIFSIDAKEFNSLDIKDIPLTKVINEIEGFNKN